MSLRLVTEDPQQARGRLEFLDRAFERVGHESKLLSALAADHPAFEPGLCLFAERDGQTLGSALFLERTLWLRECPVRVAICAPFVTLASARRQGVGRFLLETGFRALLDRRMRGAVTLGGEGFFARFGFGPAFDLNCLSTRRQDLPREQLPGWRGLVGSDLPLLPKLHERCYRTTSGSERRAVAAIEWESASPDSHSLAFESSGTVHAYLRFRVRRSIELRECAVADEAGIHAVLCFLGQLLDEHHRPGLEAYLPPSHPVARALFMAGALAQSSNFGEAALLCALDWPGILADTAVGWRTGLLAAELHAASLEIGGECFGFTLQGQELSIEPGVRHPVHLWTPPEWGPGLLTGQKNRHDLFASDSFVRGSPSALEQPRLLEAWFPARSAQWTYSPLFELADA